MDTFLYLIVIRAPADVTILRWAGDLSRVYSCVSPNDHWDRFQHPTTTLNRSK